jgi:hypothetical protein
MAEKKSCDNCGYAGRCGADRCCDYILIERHSRPCPPSDGCEAWKSKDEVKKRSLMVEEMKPIVPTEEAMRWKRLFEEQAPDTVEAWKAKRRKERAEAIAQLHLGTKERREMNGR